MPSHCRIGKVNMWYCTLIFYSIYSLTDAIILMANASLQCSVVAVCMYSCHSISHTGVKKPAHTQYMSSPFNRALTWSRCVRILQQCCLHSKMLLPFFCTQHRSWESLNENTPRHFFFYAQVRTGTVKQGDLVTFKADSLTDDLNNSAKPTSTTIKVQTQDELVLVFLVEGLQIKTKVNCSKMADSCLGSGSV